MSKEWLKKSQQKAAHITLSCQDNAKATPVMFCKAKIQVQRWQLKLIRTIWSKELVKGESGKGREN